MLSHLFHPYGLLMRVPVAERPRFGPREQLRYVDVVLALREATTSAHRLPLLLEKTSLELVAGRAEEALACLDQADVAARELGGERGLEVRYLRGKALYRSSSFDAAVAEFRAVATGAGSGGMLSRRAFLQLGRVQLHQGRFAQAIADLRAGLEGEGHTRHNAVGGWFDLVFALLHESLLEEADAALRSVAALADLNDPADGARLTYYRGWVSWQRRHASEAAALLEQASRDFAQMEEHDAFACAELALARLEIDAPELKACADRCERARALPLTRPDVAIALSLLRGLALLLAGRLSECEGEYRRAERQAERAGRADLRCRALEWSAHLHALRDESERAIAALTQALELHRKVGNPLGEAIALGTLARAHRLAGRVPEAAAAIREARALVERIGNRQELARLELEETQAAIDRGDLAAADAHGREALRLYELLGKGTLRSLALRHLAEVAALRDDFEEAERIYARSIERLGERPSRILLAETLASRAQSRADAERLEDALRDLADARALAEAAGSALLAEELRGQAEELRERHAAQAVLSRYMEPRIAARLLARGPRRLAGNVQQDVTLLFSDIRGYTTLTERLGPHETVAFLNEHFTAMTEEIALQGGTIDKFIGDAVMAVFGDPGRPRPDDPERAVRAALGMSRRRRELNEQRAALGMEPIRIGIGIDTGPVVMGNIGSPRRQAFTVIGDAVNVAARLEALTKELKTEILLSGAVSGRIGHVLRTRPLGSFDLKGRVGKVDVFTVEA
ncbi:MAG: adenylate/guanylate cyclase domain-containing protein [Planctomycetes bacterium]|nr:adenylate/guanylate cyclase domain-containing protein [Planctomycetota bacterium]